VSQNNSVTLPLSLPLQKEVKQIIGGVKKPAKPITSSSSSKGSSNLKKGPLKPKKLSVFSKAVRSESSHSTKRRNSSPVTSLNGIHQKQAQMQKEIAQ